MKKNKPTKTHFTCKNCQVGSKVTYKNGALFCAGLVKHPYPECDKWRFCISKDDKHYAFDVMFEEALSIVQVMSTALLQYLTQNPYTNKNDQNKTK